MSDDRVAKNRMGGERPVAFLTVGEHGQLSCGLDPAVLKQHVVAPQVQQVPANRGPVLRVLTIFKGAIEKLVRQPRSGIAPGAETVAVNLAIFIDQCPVAWKERNSVRSRPPEQAVPEPGTPR